MIFDKSSEMVWALGIIVIKHVSLDQIQLSSEFESHCVPHNFDLLLQPRYLGLRTRFRHIGMV